MILSRDTRDVGRGGVASVEDRLPQRRTSDGGKREQGGSIINT